MTFLPPLSSLYFRAEHARATTSLLCPICCVSTAVAHVMCICSPEHAHERLCVCAHVCMYACKRKRVCFSVPTILCIKKSDEAQSKDLGDKPLKKQTPAPAVRLTFIRPAALMDSWMMGTISGSGEARRLASYWMAKRQRRQGYVCLGSEIPQSPLFTWSTFFVTVSLKKSPPPPPSLYLSAHPMPSEDTPAS